MVVLIFNASKTCKSPLAAGFEETKVSALINPVSKDWDIDLLLGLFARLEVELVSSIPLSHTSVEDKFTKLSLDKISLLGRIS